MFIQTSWSLWFPLYLWMVAKSCTLLQNCRISQASASLLCFRSGERHGVPWSKQQVEAEILGMTFGWKPIKRWWLTCGQRMGLQLKQPFILLALWILLCCRSRELWSTSHCDILCYDLFWYTIYVDICWYILIDYDILWYILIYFDISWYFMIHHILSLTKSW